jgi:hypothetical protein
VSVYVIRGRLIIGMRAPQQRPRIGARRSPLKYIGRQAEICVINRGAPAIAVGIGNGRRICARIDLITDIGAILSPIG